MAKQDTVKAGLPSDFLWGFATAAYQVEGAVDEEGRRPSIWDKFCSIPGKIADASSCAVACDAYHRTTEDIELLKRTGAKAYRFSISWSRIIPMGGRRDPINQAGIDHYVKFVADLLQVGIVPFVTLFHWDLPEELQRKYGEMLNKEEFVADFVNYASIVFKALSPQVEHWITFNEPFCTAIMGHHNGVFAPGRSSNRNTSLAGDSAREPWVVGHNILLAHSTAVKLYREQFRTPARGMIGITLNGDWAEPWDSTSAEDIAACSRKLEFSISWFADPIYLGQYPESMRQQLGDRLPTFTAEEQELVQGSNDFYGMNHYCSHYIRHKETPASRFDCNGNVEVLFQNRNGDLIGPKTQCSWLRPNPAGFRKLLKWLSDRYGCPVIYVTENGTSVFGENDLSREQILQDDFRCEFFKGYIGAMAEAVAQDGVDVRGHMAWSLLDNFEWADGYVTRFGVTYVDYNDGQKRYLKRSALQMKDVFDRYIGLVDRDRNRIKE